MDELLRQMSAQQLEEWRAYYELEPWGGVRGDLQAGIVASALWNIYRDRRKRSEPFEPGDFVLSFEGEQEPASDQQEPVKQMTPEEVNRVMRMMFGG